VILGTLPPPLGQETRHRAMLGAREGERRCMATAIGSVLPCAAVAVGAPPSPTPSMLQVVESGGLALSTGRGEPLVGSDRH